MMMIHLGLKDVLLKIFIMVIKEVNTNQVFELNHDVCCCRNFALESKIDKTFIIIFIKFSSVDVC